VDLFTNISFGSYNTTLDFADTPNLKRIGWLLENQFPVTQLQGAAFQLAVWDIVHDNADGFAPGAGKVSQSTDVAHPTDLGVLAAAVQYEAVSVGQSSTFGIVYHNVTLSGGLPAQNLMGPHATDGGPSPKTPEPAALLMIVSGLALIGLGRLRRARD
jgi:hypothetical protein